VLALGCPENNRDEFMPQVGATDQSQSVSGRVPGAIAAAATRTGVDFDYLLNQARVESAMNPNARAKTSSAAGLFQFTRQTWLATVKSHGGNHDLGWAADAISRGPDGRYHVADAELRQQILNLRYQPEAASSMAAELASDNQDYLTGRLGRQPEDVDLYLAHFLGAAGAARFLKAHAANPDDAAAPMLPSAAAANRSIFYTRDGAPRTLDAIRNRFAARLQNQGQSVQFAANPAATFLPPLALATAPAQFADATKTEFPPMLAIQPMPHRLSLDFARSAYQRLAVWQSGGAA
jgi:Transglycosylase SLT domain